MSLFTAAPIGCERHARQSARGEPLVDGKGRLAKGELTRVFVMAKGPARCVGSTLLSNGKKQGAGNVKNGNRYLAWAFVEAAQFARRYSDQAKRFYERKRAQTNTAVATKALAHKLARACYHLLKQNAPFDAVRCFG